MSLISTKTYKHRALSESTIYQQVYAFIRNPDLLYVYRSLLYILSRQISITILILYLSDINITYKHLNLSETPIYQQVYVFIRKPDLLLVY